MSGAVCRSGVYLIWSRGRHFSPLLPYREEGRYLHLRSEGPTASKSDHTGQNPGMTSLELGTPMPCLEVLRFSLSFNHQRMRKCSGSSVRTIPKKDTGFYKELTFQLIL